MARDPKNVEGSATLIQLGALPITISIATIACERNKEKEMSMVVEVAFSEVICYGVNSPMSPATSLNHMCPSELTTMSPKPASSVGTS